MSNTTDQNWFYVGYLPLPRRLRTFVIAVIVVWLAGMVAAAALIASRQQDPGPGVWDLSKPVTIEGQLRVQPYPIIYVDDDNGSPPVRSVLLVSENKFGARDRALPLHGQRVGATGYLISRQGRTLLELLSEDDAIVSAANGGDTSAPAAKSLGKHTLLGEIIDPKCYMGVMKPGRGKTHRACAVRCIAGGIPPMFVTRDADGNATLYLLIGTNGEMMNEKVLPYVADPVELTGRLEQRGDLMELFVDHIGIAPRE